MQLRKAVGEEAWVGALDLGWRRPGCRSQPQSCVTSEAPGGWCDGDPDPAHQLVPSSPTSLSWVGLSKWVGQGQLPVATASFL